MKQTTSINLVILFVSLWILNLAPNMLAGEKECDLATLQGDYLMTGRGIPPDTPPRITRITRITLGVVIFDGKGHLSGKETWSTDGEIRRVTYEGTYTLDADCTGTLNVTDAHWDLVLTKDAEEGVLIRTDPGTMLTRSLKKR